MHREINIGTQKGTQLNDTQRKQIEIKVITNLISFISVSCVCFSVYQILSLLAQSDAELPFDNEED